MAELNKYTPNLRLGIRLKTIILLRSIAVIGQLVTCLVVSNFLNFKLPYIEVYLTIGALALSNFILFLYISNTTKPNKKIRIGTTKFFIGIITYNQFSYS